MPAVPKEQQLLLVVASVVGLFNVCSCRNARVGGEGRGGGVDAMPAMIEAV